MASKLVSKQPKRGYHAQVLPNQVYEGTRRNEIVYVLDGWHLEQCTGNVHSNPLESDHCMACLGGVWGWAPRQDGDITITVRSQTAGGKTTVALLLAEFLQSRGFDVTNLDEDFATGSHQPSLQPQRVEALASEKRIAIRTQQVRKDELP